MTDNDNTPIGLSRRRVLGGIGAIGVASAGAGLGTTAFFSDEESFENNTITAGQLDLSVTWQQLYYGGPQATRPGDYGAAERPFVNAYPDSDGNGLQSFELLCRLRGLRPRQSFEGRAGGDRVGAPRQIGLANRSKGARAGTASALPGRSASPALPDRPRSPLSAATAIG